MIPSKVTKHSVSVFAQLVQNLPKRMIESLARKEKIKAREFSYSTQMYLLMLGQMLHAFSLNELTDISRVHRCELARVRGITSALRRVEAIVEIDGKTRNMVFLTNNLFWSAHTIAELYKSRWSVELLFKELKQTLQLQTFYGSNANAVGWQVWAALTVHLLLRFMKFVSKVKCSYTRFVGIVRTALWVKRNVLELLRFYGMDSPPEKPTPVPDMPYLPGFEKAFVRAMGQKKVSNAS